MLEFAWQRPPPLRLLETIGVARPEQRVRLLHVEVVRQLEPAQLREERVARGPAPGDVEQPVRLLGAAPARAAAWSRAASIRRRRPS